MKQIARREAEGSSSNPTEKKISSKGRGDYLVHPEGAELEGSPERTTGRLDFSEAIDQERESDEEGKIMWEKSSLDPAMEDDHHRPESTEHARLNRQPARGGVSGGGKD